MVVIELGGEGRGLIDFVSINSRLESNKEEKKKKVGG